MPTFPLDPTLPETIRPVLPALRERVEAGAAWLDSIAPDWRHLIDIDTLDLSDSEHCVLGQTFAADAADLNYLDGFDYALGYIVPFPRPRTGAEYQGRHGWLEARGFDVRSSAHGFDYESLTSAWRRYLDGED